jgi:hypothetical protein
MVPTANNGKAISTFDMGGCPERCTLEAKTSSQRIDLTCYILFDNITTPDSSSCPDEGNIVRIVIHTLHLGLKGVI